jgi:predicted SAM-dependent methyltransferase
VGASHRGSGEGRFKYLKPGGYLRCAVPDGNYPDPAYRAIARVGGPGPPDHPAADHKMVYDCRSLSDAFDSAGFEVDLLEYCDEGGRFHYNQWSPEGGPVYRSLHLDQRNRGGRIRVVSLIVDARKTNRALAAIGATRLRCFLSCEAGWSVLGRAKGLVR